MKDKFMIMFFAGMGGWILNACSERDEVPSEGDGSPVCISAAVSEMESRAGTDVTSGHFVLSYTAAGGTALAGVTFEGETGFPLVENSASGTGSGTVYRILDWSDVIRTGANYVFTLDNVESELSGSISLDEDTYKAQQEEGATNDILWNNLSVTTQGDLHFDLRHRMSKISVEVTRDGSSSTLSDVTVVLKNVRDKAASFDRSTGAVTAAADIPADGVTLLEDGGLAGDNAETPAWIFPPQTFADNSRPVLRVEVDGKAYEATLPPSMINGSDGSGTPADLQFQAGRHLTIRARLTESITGTQIIFMPVQVEQWEDKGNLSIIASQIGVYDEEDYAELVETYNDDTMDAARKEARLAKYGTYDTESSQWTFVIFATIGDADGLAAAPKFKDNKFDMEFNGHTVYGVSESNRDDLIQPDASEGGEQP